MRQAYPPKIRPNPPSRSRAMLTSMRRCLMSRLRTMKMKMKMKTRTRTKMRTRTRTRTVVKRILTQMRKMKMKKRRMKMRDLRMKRTKKGPRKKRALMK